MFIQYPLQTLWDDGVNNFNNVRPSTTDPDLGVLVKVMQKFLELNAAIKNIPEGFWELRIPSSRFQFYYNKRF